MQCFWFSFNSLSISCYLCSKRNKIQMVLIVAFLHVEFIYLCMNKIHQASFILLIHVQKRKLFPCAQNVLYQLYVRRKNKCSVYLWLLMQKTIDVLGKHVGHMNKSTCTMYLYNLIDWFFFFSLYFTDLLQKT